MKNEQKKKIVTDDTLREAAAHGDPDFPFEYYLEDIWLFDFHAIDWHWHHEVEFVYVKEGLADLWTGSRQITLKTGEAVFINSGVIHRFEAASNTIIPNIVFSPMLLADEQSLIYTKYIRPVLQSSAEYLVFSPDILWQKEVIQNLLSVFEIQECGIQECDNFSEIETVHILLKLWELLYRNTNIADTRSKEQSHINYQLQVMMQYIHLNYRRKITLDDIAGSVNMSKSSVLKIFSQNLHMSPIEYVIHYRLNCAVKLLRTTRQSVDAVARECGFDNTGYFCRKFKQSLQMTPSEYRSL